MPYDANDVSGLPEPVQKLSAKQRRQWVDIWTSARARCLKTGKDAKTCESSAFAQANGVVKVGSASHSAAATFSGDFVQPATFDLPAAPAPLYEDADTVYRHGLVFRAGDYPDKAYAMTPEELRAAALDFTQPVPLDLEHMPTLLDGKIGELVSVDCSEDGSELHGIVAIPKWLDSVLDERKVSATWDRATKRLAGLALVRNPRVSDAALMAAFSEAHAEMAVTKTEDGKQFRAGDYAYVPDPSQPSTWKLRLTNTPGGDPDAGIVGAAIAALGKGFRGQKVDIPNSDLPAVKRKVRAAWKKANPDKSDADMPDTIKMSADGELAESIEAMFADAQRDTPKGRAALQQIYVFASSRHDTPEGQMALQLIHNDAARGGAVCKASNTAKMASQHEGSAIQRIHDMAMEHGAMCSSKGGAGGMLPFSKAGRKRKETRMGWRENVAAAFAAALGQIPDDGDTEGEQISPPVQAKPVVPTTGTAAMSDTAAMSAELTRRENRIAQLEDENRRVWAEAILREATAFGEQMVRETKIYPAQFNAVVSGYVQAATDDRFRHDLVEFAVGPTDSPTKQSGSRVDLFKASFTSNPGHNLTVEQLVADGQRLVVLSNPNTTPTKDGPPAQTDIDALLAKTPGGRATLAARQRNGSN